MSSAIVTIAFSVATTLGALRGIQPVPEDPFPTDVPLAARVLLANAKAELRDLATALLRDQPADAKLAAANVQRAMTDALKAAGALEACDTQYGSLEEPKVSSAGDDLVAVVVVLAIPCGDDDSLFLFRHDADGWHLVLDRERNDYETVAGGAGGLEYRVSAPDEHGSRLVLVSDINPWCSSMWQSIRWEVVRLNRGWRDPEQVASGRDTIYLDTDLTLEVTPDTFGLDFTGSSIDPGRVKRDYHRHYRVLPGNRLERVEPIAGSPLDFVEEWLIENDIDLQDYGSGEFSQPARCSEGTWQIEFDFYANDDGDEEKVTYFFVAEEKGTFRMVANRAEPREGCITPVTPEPAPENGDAPAPPTTTPAPPQS